MVVDFHVGLLAHAKGWKQEKAWHVPVLYDLSVRYIDCWLRHISPWDWKSELEPC